MFGWVILGKVRAALAAAVLAFLGTGTQVLVDEEWTDLGVWGTPVGATVVALVALLTPERLARLRDYIEGKRMGTIDPTPTPPSQRQ